MIRKTNKKDVEIGFMDLTGDGFFFAIDDNYVAVHKDAKFQLIINEAGDLNQEDMLQTNLVLIRLTF